MEFFFEPRGVAVVGASPGKGKGGNIIVDNLKRGYEGPIYPVNPRYDEIEGLKCYPAVTDLPDPVDLAIVFVGAKMVPEVIDACAQRRIPGIMIQSAGFSETGDQGAELQEKATQIARRAGIRLWGPNCMGLLDANRRYVFSTVTQSLWETDLTPGNVSLIVQSGMLSGAFLIDIFSHGVMGIGKVCSVGNKMDVNENDLLPYLIDDPDTAAIGLYLENFVDIRRFMDLVRRCPKPVVVLNGGRTAKGAAAALSHTASLSADGAIAGDALAQVGVTQADDFYQMLDFCRSSSTFADYTPVLTTGVPADSPKGIAVLTYSGAAGIVSADLMEQRGMAPAELQPETLKALEAVFPAWMPPANPVDLWPGVIINGGDKAFGEALTAVCADPGVDAILAHLFVGGFNLEVDLEAMAATARAAGKPLMCWLSGEQEIVRRYQQIGAKTPGVEIFREISRAIECLDLVLNNRLPQKETLPQPPLEAPSAPKTMGELGIPGNASGDLDEHISKQILHRLQVPVVPEHTVLTVAEAIAAAQKLGYPVVAKGLLPGEAHKTEANLVLLGLATANQLESAFDHLQDTMQGRGTVLIQKQIAGKIELVVGFVRDAQFGPCVMCGLGGIFTEALKTTVFAVAPLTQGDALNMLKRLPAQTLLNGYRGCPAVDRTALADIIVAVGNLGNAVPRIREIDINPLIVQQNGQPLAVDALIVMAEDS